MPENASDCIREMKRNTRRGQESPLNAEQIDNVSGLTLVSMCCSYGHRPIKKRTKATCSMRKQGLDQMYNKGNMGLQGKF